MELLLCLVLLCLLLLVACILQFLSFRRRQKRLLQRQGDKMPKSGHPKQAQANVEAKNNDGDIGDNGVGNVSAKVGGNGFRNGLGGNVSASDKENLASGKVKKVYGDVSSVDRQSRLSPMNDQGRLMSHRRFLTT